MPIFEYRCEDCGSQFEKLVRHTSDAVELRCPSCGKDHLAQQLSTFAAHSGSGKTSGDSMPACPSGTCCSPGFCGLN